MRLSEVTAAELRQAYAVHPIAAVQSEWSLWSRDVERAVVPAAAELAVGFVARVDQNVASLDVRLDAAQRKLLDDLAGAVVGPRSDHSDPNWVSATRE